MPFSSGFVFGERFNVEAENFGEDGHSQLGEDDSEKPKPEGSGAEGSAEVISNARAEGVGQRGEEKVERTGEF